MARTPEEKRARVVRNLTTVDQKLAAAEAQIGSLRGEVREALELVKPGSTGRTRGGEEMEETEKVEQTQSTETTSTEEGAGNGEESGSEESGGEESSDGGE